MFKNSRLIFKIYIMLIRVDKNSSGLCLLLEPFPDIVDTEPFYFSLRIFFIRREDKSWKLAHYMTLKWSLRCAEVASLWYQKQKGVFGRCLHYSASWSFIIGLQWQCTVHVVEIINDFRSKFINFFPVVVLLFKKHQ